MGAPREPAEEAVDALAILEAAHQGLSNRVEQRDHGGVLLVVAAFGILACHRRRCHSRSSYLV